MSNLQRKEMAYVSAIIGIAGTNFCTFVADQRLVSFHGNDIRVLRDDFPKIFKINDRVLFGATGLLNPHEDILEPLKCYAQRDPLSVKMVYRAAVDYMKKNKSSLPGIRNYLIGGKDKEGHFVIYEVHWNPKIQKAETTIREPQPPQFNFAISCCLPPAMESDRQAVLDDVGRKITTGDQRHGEMAKRIQGTIEVISKCDPTVSSNSIVLNVF